MKFVIWGAGFKGKKLLKLLTDKRVIAFIDSDKKKIGTEIDGIMIISYEMYKKKYSNYFIIISNTDFSAIENKLIGEKIYNYFILSDCPSEFLGYGISDLEQLLKGKDIVENKDCYVWGANLYSIILINQFMKTKKYTNIYCIPHKRIRTETIGEIQKKYGIQMISSKAISSNMQGDLFLTIRDEYDQVLEQNVKLNKINAYDFSKKISKYKNVRLEKFRDIHYGERCFIIGTGPSLRKDDLEMLWKNKEKTFGVNNIFKLDNSSWKPDYYMVLDHAVICKYIKDIEDYDIRYKFINDCATEFWNCEQKSSCYKIHGITNDLSDVLPEFSENIITGVYTGATVTYGCIQLAVYMGFKEIILLGVDCNYVKGSKNNHFFEDSQIDNADHHENKMIESYMSAKKYAETHGIRIRNATRGGLLEIFERIDFDDLF